MAESTDGNEEQMVKRVIVGLDPEPEGDVNASYVWCEVPVTQERVIELANAEGYKSAEILKETDEIMPAAEYDSKWNKRVEHAYDF